MDKETLQKVDMIEKIFEQTKDRKLRRALLNEVVSSKGVKEPIKVRPNRLKTKHHVSKMRKFILLLLIPVEIACEIMIKRPWLSLFTIFGVILFIGKFVSAKVAGIMAFTMFITFLIMERIGGAVETDGEVPCSVGSGDPILLDKGDPVYVQHPMWLQ